MRSIKVRNRAKREVLRIICIFFAVGFVVMATTSLAKARATHNGRFLDTRGILPLDQEPVLHQKKIPTQSTHVEFISQTAEFREYVMLRKTRVNLINHKFIVSGNLICKQPPYLLIVCLSKHINIELREAIRDTWGNWSNDKLLSNSPELSSVKLIFMFGTPGNSTVLRELVMREHNRYGDIVMADFEDTYENLTTKVLTSFKWASNYCRGLQFLLKVDDDTFVHVPNLINYLRSLAVSDKGIIVGHGEFQHKVLRSGRWELSRDVYPLDEYPPYVSGNSYVISGNIISRLFSVAEFLPYIYIEDVFVTGLVREVIGAELRHRAGFTWWMERFPRLCGFHNAVRISATNMDARLIRQLWRALHLNLTNCYDATTLQKLEYVDRWPPKSRAR